MLRGFSLTHQRQETYKALQLQSRALPDVVDKLQAMMAQMDSMSQQLNARLLSNQDNFHSEVKSVYTDLARSVDQSLRDSLTQSAQVAGESIQPVVVAAMTSLVTNMDRSVSALGEAFGQRSSALLAEVKDTYASLQAQQAASDSRHGNRMDQLVTLLHNELSALREAEALRGNAAVERLGDLQTALTGHLTTLGTALEDPITRLIQTASEAPRAAAEVIGKLRQEISSSVARDNELLEERSHIMETLNSLLGAINHASVEQRAVIDSLVTSSAAALNQAGGQFSDKVDAEAAKLADIAAHVTSSAVEVSSLSESFSFAVRSFGDANDKLISNLQRIEAAMDKSMARSDEQLAYYVAQAREVIDLSIMSQKEIFEELRQLPKRVGEEVAHG